MSISQTLNLVRGAVSDKNLISVLTHFHITDGKIYGNNGRISIEAPFPKIHDDPITVPGASFVTAVDRCDGDPQIEIGDGFMKMKSKTRKMRMIRLPLSTDDYSKPVTIGDRYEIEDPKEYIEAIRRVSPFVSSDASRPWAMSVLHQGDHLYATNNIIMVRTEYDWPDEYPIFGLPGFTVDEMVRIRREPKYVWIHDNGVAYEYDDDVWLRSVRYATDWPDVAPMIPDCSGLPKLPSDTAQVVRDLVPFAQDKSMPIVTFKGNEISTMEGQMIAVDSLAGEVGEASFHAVPLQLALSRATHMDVSTYPKPCPWRGENLEGIIIGVRL